MNWRDFIKNHNSTVMVPKIKNSKSGFNARRISIPNQGSATLLAMIK